MIIFKGNVHFVFSRNVRVGALLCAAVLSAACAWHIGSESFFSSVQRASSLNRDGTCPYSKCFEHQATATCSDATQNEHSQLPQQAQHQVRQQTRIKITLRCQNHVFHLGAGRCKTPQTYASMGARVPLSRSISPAQHRVEKEVAAKARRHRQLLRRRRGALNSRTTQRNDIPQ